MNRLFEERVLVLAPTGRDGPLVVDTLVANGMRPELCGSMGELCRHAADGAGALFLAEEALTPEGILLLSALVETQEPWSDIPIIVSTGVGTTTERRIRNLSAIGKSGNIVILERPVRILTMAVTIQSALRARRRQYQMRDLTNQIEHARAKLEALIMQVPVALCILEGPQLRVTVANASFHQMTGWRVTIGQPLSELFEGLEQTGLLAIARQVFQTGQARDVDEYAFSFGAEPGHYQTSFRALTNETGHVIGVVAATVTLTEQVRARQALELSRAEADEARAAAESANRAKDEFLAMLGHELRNPLAPILTALELMRLRDGNWAQRERAIIERQTQHMTALVEDLLDISRVTRSKVALRSEVVDLHDTLAKATETAAPLFETRQHQLVSQLAPGTLFVTGDPARLTQVFSNILTNAAKYTDDRGRITIDAESTDGRVAVRISDTGRGISAEMLPHVFDLFMQERQNIDRSEGGLGLGLAIVKNLVEMHGGRVSVTSEGQGLGSQFTVELPGAAPPTLQRREPSETTRLSAQKRVGERATGKIILVVDDNKDAAEMMAEALDFMGYGTRIAHDGPQALALARNLLPPLAAFVDIGLPVMDGYELARRLRALAGWQNVSLVAVTGYGQENDRRQTRAAGFDNHLIKPVGLASLKEALESVYGPTT